MMLEEGLGNILILLDSCVSTPNTALTSKAWLDTAGLYCSFPACEAFTTTSPTPVKVMIESEIVAGPETILNEIGRPELLLAERAKGGSSANLSGIESKVIVCESFTTGENTCTRLL